MTRLTEYHEGVAVIKGKRFKEAAEKLARIEDGLEKLNEYANETGFKIFATLAAFDEKIADMYFGQHIGIKTAINILECGGSDE